jgi:phosphatidylserine/phosphatidylglycerophosphate/cardiolipin synthase-like enzyme
MIAPGGICSEPLVLTGGGGRLKVGNLAGRALRAIGCESDGGRPVRLGPEPDQKARAAMHAKVVVVDRKVAFVSSANLTERAQERNIEVGALIREESLARQLAEYFEGLEREGVLRSAGGEVDH